MKLKAKASVFPLTLAVPLGVFLAGSLDEVAQGEALAPEGDATSAPDGEARVTPSPPSDLASGPVPCAAALDRLASIMSAWSTPLLAPAGWLHLRDEVYRDGLDVGTFPDGRPIPEDYVFDHWDLIGDDGLVLRSVAIMYDLAGEVVQVSTFDGKTWVNHTFGFRYAGEPFRPALDGGLGAAIQMGRNLGCGYALGTRSGKPTVEISFHEDYPHGLTLGNYPERVSRITWRGIFDPQSNALLTFEQVFTTFDGRERLVEVATVLATERVASPPEDVLSLLEEGSRGRYHGSSLWQPHASSCSVWSSSTLRHLQLPVRRRRVSRTARPTLADGRGSTTCPRIGTRASVATRPTPSSTLASSAGRGGQSGRSATGESHGRSRARLRLGPTPVATAGSRASPSSTVGTHAWDGRWGTMTSTSSATSTSTHTRSTQRLWPRGFLPTAGIDRNQHSRPREPRRQ